MEKIYIYLYNIKKHICVPLYAYKPNDFNLIKIALTYGKERSLYFKKTGCDERDIVNVCYESLIYLGLPDSSGWNAHTHTHGQKPDSLKLR